MEIRTRLSNPGGPGTCPVCFTEKATETCAINAAPATWQQPIRAPDLPVPSCPERHKHFPSLSQNLKHSGVKAPLREVLGKTNLQMTPGLHSPKNLHSTYSAKPEVAVPNPWCTDKAWATSSGGRQGLTLPSIGTTDGSLIEGEIARFSATAASARRPRALRGGVEESFGRLVSPVRAEAPARAAAASRLRSEGRLEGAGFSRVDAVFDSVA